jgi:hypothetical protein
VLLFPFPSLAGDPAAAAEEAAMAGRYDRNPFDEDDVNPFAVSNRCTFVVAGSSDCSPL